MVSRLSSTKTSYDDIADVFYLTISADRPGRYAEDDDGIIWRFNEKGEPIGVTVQAYHILWASRRASLAQRIAQPLRLDAATVAQQLPI